MEALLRQLPVQAQGLVVLDGFALVPARGFMAEEDVIILRIHGQAADLGDHLVNGGRVLDELLLPLRVALRQLQDPLEIPMLPQGARGELQRVDLPDAPAVLHLAMRAICAQQTAPETVHVIRSTVEHQFVARNGVLKLTLFSQFIGPLEFLQRIAAHRRAAVLPAAFVACDQQAGRIVRFHHVAARIAYHNRSHRWLPLQRVDSIIPFFCMCSNT